MPASTETRTPSGRIATVKPTAQPGSQRVLVAAGEAATRAAQRWLAECRHRDSYELEVLRAGEDVQLVLRQRTCDIYLLDEWALGVVAGLPPEQRRRIERRSVCLTALEAAGPAALVCNSTLPLSRLNAFVLDHALWQVARQFPQVSVPVPLRPDYDVLLDLARTKLSSGADVGAALRPLTEAAGVALGVGRVSVWVIRDAPKRLVCVDMYDCAGDSHQSGLEVPAALVPAYCMALHHHRILSIEDAVADERSQELADFYLRPAGIGALLDAPIYLDGQVVGLFCHAHLGGTRRWSDEEQRLAASFADYAQMVLLAKQRHDAEAALDAARDELAQAHKLESLGRLTGGIAHDFNNILTVLSGNAEILSERMGSGDRHLNGILAACARAEALVHKLMSFTRKAPRQPAWVEINGLIDGLCGMLVPTLGQAVMILPRLEKAPLVVFGDRDELQHALINLAVNARDAMPRGGSLTFTTRRLAAVEAAAVRPLALDGTRSWLELTVGDTGSGMTPDVLRRSMEPFFTTKDPGKGTGLGLTNVYACVRKHLGHIACESAPGEGTRFRIYLPLGEGAEVPVADPKSAAAPHGAGRILLVDDDPDVRSTVGEMLGFLGYTVTAFAEGAAALDRLRAQPDAFDLALLDMVMPGMSGPACFSALRVLAPGLPCLLMSGCAADTAVRACLDDGALALLDKPFALSTCAQAVEKALTLRRAMLVG